MMQCLFLFFFLGPRWLPILGSALEVARIRKETGFLHETCTQLSRKYGPVFGLKIGKDRIVVLNNYESMRSLLTNEDCDGRPTGPVYEARTFGERRGEPCSLADSSCCVSAFRNDPYFLAGSSLFRNIARGSPRVPTNLKPKAVDRCTEPLTSTRKQPLCSTRFS